jgi:hypothetical protein
MCLGAHHQVQIADDAICCWYEQMGSRPYALRRIIIGTL